MRLWSLHKKAKYKWLIIIIDLKLFNRDFPLSSILAFIVLKELPCVWTHP